MTGDDVSIAFSVAIYDGDKKFQGMVVSGLDPAYFQSVLSQIRPQGEGTAASLFNSHGDFICRIPDREAPQGDGGAVNEVMRAHFAANRSMTRQIGTSRIDGVKKLFVIGIVGKTGIHVAVSRNLDDILIEWHETVYAEIFIFITTTAILFTLSSIAFRRERERKRADDALREASQLNKAIIESAHEGVIVYGRDLRFKLWNPFMEQLMGVNAREVLGRHPLEAFPLLDKVSHLERIENALRGTRQETIDIQFTDPKTGGSRWAADTSNPLYNADGEIIGVLATVSDITERKNNEKKLEEQAIRLTAINAELERFAYIAAHDLREPVRLVSNYLTLIEKSFGDDMSEVTRRYFRFAVTGAKRMDQMIRDLLDYSRIGKTEGKFQKISLNDVTDQSLLQLSMTIAESEAQVVVAESLPEVWGVDSELTRLFQNLIGNAIKYRHAEKKPEIEIGWREEGADWIIWVRDNGMGIAPQYREQVFAVFHRLVPKDLYEGTGIGLAVCRRIVEHHGGRIWIEDAADGGCVFAMTFPRSAVA